MSQSDKTLYEDELGCIKLLPFIFKLNKLTLHHSIIACFLIGLVEISAFNIEILLMLIDYRILMKGEYCENGRG